MDKFALLKLRRRVPRGKAWFAVAALAAVAGTGVAIAAGNLATTKSVDASFSATTVKHRTVKTCTGADGDTYEITHATYTGSADSDDSRLDGSIVISVKSVYNTTKELGHLTGNFRGDKARGNLSAVNKDGELEGFLKGGVRDSAGKLFANISADYSSAGGFDHGELGNGSPDNTAVIIGGACPEGQGAQGSNAPKGPKGPKGATGATGPKGPKGATGATGHKGPKGPKGPKGATGHKGATGATGHKGATGATGTTGSEK
jgi:collagen type VII alpha